MFTEKTVFAYPSVSLTAEEAKKIAIFVIDLLLHNLLHNSFKEYVKENV